ncbi:MAG: hypothetical protein AB1638_11370 [Nitrospirota bacterium]
MKKQEEIIERLRKNCLKVNLLREEFKRKEEDVRRDLEEASRIWGELSERFRWWQKQELP